MAPGLYTKKRRRITIGVMLFMLLIVIVLATSIGSVGISFLKTIRIIMKNWGIKGNYTFARGEESIIFFVRFPRVITAVLVGASLGVAGAIMQGMFRNPMADPGVLGVSAGASLGAVIAISTGAFAEHSYHMVIFACTGSLLAAFTVYLLSSKGGRVPVMNLLLSGIAVSMFFGAVTTGILSFIRSDQVRQFLFWTMGSLNGRRWDHVRLIFFPALIFITVLMFFTRELNVLMLGEEEAHSVGVNPQGTRKILMLVSSLLTALAVSISGTISFVGLIVPHIIRLLVGPDHRILIPASALGGALFLVLCDLLGRVIFAPADLGVGIITSLIGAPYFLFLLSRSGREGGPS